MTVGTHSFRRTRRGLTLVEVMLAMALLATMVGLTWGTVAQSYRLQRASLDRYDRHRGVQMALDRMARELSMAFVTNVGQVATNEQNEITYRTIFEGRDDEIVFTALAHLRTRVGEPASEQCELTYRIESMRGEDGEMHRNLVRREDAPIDDDPESGGVTFVLLEDVEDITFEFWDGDQEIAGEAWTPQWDAIEEQSGRLPERVRITVEVEHPSRRNETLTFTTQTSLHLTKPLVVLPSNLAAQLNQIQDELENAQQDQQDEALEQLGDAINEALNP